jgi:hypothetical protein
MVAAVVLSSLLSFSVTQLLASILLTLTSLSFLMWYTVYLRYKIMIKVNRATMGDSAGNVFVRIPITELLVTSNPVEMFRNVILLLSVWPRRSASKEITWLPIFGIVLVLVHSITIAAIPLLIVETSKCSGYSGTYPTTRLNADTSADPYGIQKFVQTSQNRSLAGVPSGAYLRHSPIMRGWRYSESDLSDRWRMDELGYSLTSYYVEVNGPAIFDVTLYNLSTAIPALDNLLKIGHTSIKDLRSSALIAASTNNGTNFISGCIFYFQTQSNATNATKMGTTVLATYGTIILDRMCNAPSTVPKATNPAVNCTVYVQLRNTLATRIALPDKSSTPASQQPGEYNWLLMDAYGAVTVILGVLAEVILVATDTYGSNQYNETEWFGPEQLATYMQVLGTEDYITEMDTYRIALSCVSINYYYLVILFAGCCLYLEIAREKFIMRNIKQNGRLVSGSSLRDIEKALLAPGTSSGWLAIAVKEHYHQHRFITFQETTQSINIALERGMSYGVEDNGDRVKIGMISARDDTSLQELSFDRER